MKSNHKKKGEKNAFEHANCMLWRGLKRELQGSPRKVDEVQPERQQQKKDEYTSGRELATLLAVAESNGKVGSKFGSSVEFLEVRLDNPRQGCGQVLPGTKTGEGRMQFRGNIRPPFHGDPELGQPEGIVEDLTAAVGSAASPVSASASRPVRACL